VRAADGNIGAQRDNPALRMQGVDIRDAVAFEERVKAYNLEVKNYNACMQAYIDGARVEIKRTQEQANIDIRRITDSANDRVHKIEAKIADAMAD